MNIHSLHQKDELKLLEARCGYDEILRNCKTYILDVYTGKEDYQTLYGIPYNYPTKYYKFIDCIIYIIQQLRRDGFYVRYLKPNYLYISWFNEKMQKQKKENLKQLIFEHNETQKMFNKSTNNKITYVKFNDNTH